MNGGWRSIFAPALHKQTFDVGFKLHAFFGYLYDGESEQSDLGSLYP
jgi:hypothetical protein